MSRRAITILFLVIMMPHGGIGPTSAQEIPDSESQVVAYYFHRTFRCQTCLKIEDLAKNSITGHLASDIDSGELAWQSNNIEKPEFAHFEEEFNIEGPSLVITRYADGKLQEWIILERVWDLTEDPKEFDEYVTGAVEKYLETVSGYSR
jgi:hypothetical protein